jgi:hypothetical protein
MWNKQSSYIPVADSWLLTIQRLDWLALWPVLLCVSKANPSSVNTSIFHKCAFSNRPISPSERLVHIALSQRGAVLFLILFFLCNSI